MEEAGERRTKLEVPVAAERDYVMLWADLYLTLTPLTFLEAQECLLSLLLLPKPHAAQYPLATLYECLPHLLHLMCVFPLLLLPIDGVPFTSLTL